MEAAGNILKEILKPGDTLTCVRVNRGNQGKRHIIVLMVEGGKISDITSYVARTVETKRSPDGGIPCQDLGHDLIAALCLRLGWEYKALNVQII